MQNKQKTYNQSDWTYIGIFMTYLYVIDLTYLVFIKQAMSNFDKFNLNTISKSRKFGI